MSPLVRLRALVTAWRTAQASVTRARWAGEEPDVRGLTRARAALGTGEARALLDECLSLHLLDDRDHATWLTHLADAAREELLHRRGAAPGLALSHEVEIEGEPITLAAIARDASRWLDRGRLEGLGRAVGERDRARREAVAEGDAAAERVLSRGPERKSEDLDVLAWLSATDDATHEALARTAHALGFAATRGNAAEKLAILPRALRASALDALFAPAGRVDRLARLLAPIGTDATVAARLRLETSGEATIRSELVLVDPPTRIAVGLPAIEIGLATELVTLDALGRGLAHALVTPALGAEHRVLPASEVPPAMGALLALLPTDARYLRRALGLDARAEGAVRPAATYVALCRARLELARLHARREHLLADGDTAHALASRAIACPSDLPIGALLASPETTPTLLATAHAAAAAPAIFLALRERHDEDFFRNPRTRDTLAGAAARGARLSRAEWLSELTAPADHAACAVSLAREALG